LLPYLNEMRWPPGLAASNPIYGLENQPVQSMPLRAPHYVSATSPSVPGR
jgi:hypothetical protein